MQTLYYTLRTLLAATTTLTSSVRCNNVDNKVNMQQPNNITESTLVITNKPVPINTVQASSSSAWLLLLQATQARILMIMNWMCLRNTTVQKICGNNTIGSDGGVLFTTTAAATTTSPLPVLQSNVSILLGLCRLPIQYYQHCSNNINNTSSNSPTNINNNNVR